MAETSPQEAKERGSFVFGFSRVSCFLKLEATTKRNLPAPHYLVYIKRKADVGADVGVVGVAGAVGVATVVLSGLFVSS